MQLALGSSFGPTQPSASPTSTLPCLVIVMSLKSSRLRHGTEPPLFQMQPRCTGSLGLALTVVQCAPRSYVVATYMCQVAPTNLVPALFLPNDVAWVDPRVVVPRKANAARSPSPATTSENSVWRIPKLPPASVGEDQVWPRLRDTAIIGRPLPSA